MGWGDCGRDSRGRRIGYAFAARCDEPGCHARIDRGLGFACGGMHGEQDLHGGACCEGYYCGKHLVTVDRGDHAVTVCRRCAADIRREERRRRRAA